MSETQDQLRDLLHDLERDLRNTERSLQHALTAVEDRCRRAARYLANDMSVNMLGELQGSANEVDRLCALREEQRRTAERVRGVLERSLRWAC